MGKNKAIYLLLPIILAIIIIMSLVIMQLPGNGNAVFYAGTSEVRRIEISIDEWRLIYNMLVDKYSVTNNTRIVMFGATWCPHCHKQYLFFENSSYVNKSLVLWLDQDNYAALLFDRLTQLEIKKGFTRYAGAVPHMLVIDEKGGLRAIVVGEALNDDFWNKLLK